ncbi:hypothetical protein EVAR_28107_1 [Eumeta japonica]|uniref:Uncharacterized protein n=1 Tax=Eumeta variegata TaxID=151549 RepID=A0A4C1VD86_EUMVA|nr:hypothetical protein EVAR_28107_1 [Eumeta japonica]
MLTSSASPAHDAGTRVSAYNTVGRHFLRGARHRLDRAGRARPSLHSGALSKRLPYNWRRSYPQRRRNECTLADRSPRPGTLNGATLGPKALIDTDFLPLTIVIVLPTTKTPTAATSRPLWPRKSHHSTIVCMPLALSLTFFENSSVTQSLDRAIDIHAIRRRRPDPLTFSVTHFIG